MSVDVLQPWNAPASTPALAVKRPRATWSIDEPIVPYALRHAGAAAPPPPERQQAPSPPAKRVRAHRPAGAPLLPDGWVEEVRIPASGRQYSVRATPARP